MATRWATATVMYPAANANVSQPIVVFILRIL